MEQDSEQFSPGAKLSLHPNVWNTQCAGSAANQPVPVNRDPATSSQEERHVLRLLSGGTSVISVLQAQALAGHPSHPDIQLAPPSAWGGL